MDKVENYPKMFHLLKKLAFAKVYSLGSNNQVTLFYRARVQVAISMWRNETF